MSLSRYIQKAQEALSKDLQKVSEQYIKEGRNRLREQGHYASGALDKSFETEIQGTLEGIVSAEITFNDYGIFLDTGVRPSKVKYSVNQLIPWARIVQPGKTVQELMSFLYATRQKHKTEGIGTKASSRFSSDGSRTGWIGDMVERVEKPEELISFDKVIDFVIEGISKRHGESRRA